MIYNHCYSIIKEGRYPISDCGMSVRVKNVGKAVAYTTVGMTMGFLNLVFGGGEWYEKETFVTYDGGNNDGRSHAGICRNLATGCNRVVVAK